MSLENAVYLNQLVNANPGNKDKRGDGYAQIQLIKRVLLNTFPNFGGAVTATQTELNYALGLTSDLRDQLSDKVALNSPAFSGVPKAPTKPVGSSGLNIATVGYVNAVASNGALPGQTGNAGKLLQSDGTSATWISSVVLPGSMQPVVGTNFARTTQTQTMYSKTIVSPAINDNVNATKKVQLDLSTIPTNTTVNVSIPDEDVQIGVPRYKLLSKVVHENNLNFEVDLTPYASLYAGLMIEVTDFRAADNKRYAIQAQMMVNGVWEGGQQAHYQNYPETVVLKTTDSGFAVFLKDPQGSSSAANFGDAGFFRLILSVASDNTLTPSIQVKGSAGIDINPTDTARLKECCTPLTAQITNRNGSIDKFRFVPFAVSVKRVVGLSGTVRVYGITGS